MGEMPYQKVIGPAIGSIFIEPYEEEYWKIRFENGAGELNGVRLKKGHFWAKDRVLSRLKNLTEDKLDLSEEKAEEVWEEISIELEKQWKALERERKHDKKEDKLIEDNKEVSEEVKQKAEELLEEENILQEVKRVLDGKVVGEDRNKLFLFLIMLSYKTDHPQACYVIGSSSAGKSYIVNNVKELFGDRVLWYSRITSKVLDRMGKDLAGKIFIIGEQSGAVEAESLLRQWLSEGKLKLLTNRKEKGKIKQAEIETKGKPVFVTTTTSRTIERQMGTRIWVLELDESEGQTQEILNHQAREAMGLNQEDKEALKVLKEAVRKLETYDIKVPYADKLAELFPKDNVRSRRDFKKLLSLIKVCALLHQENRPIIADKEGKVHLLATRADFEVTWKLVKDKLTPTLTGLTAQHRVILEAIGELKLDQNQVADRLKERYGIGVSQSTLYDRLRELRDWGYLRITDGSRGTGKANVYYKTKDVPNLSRAFVESSVFPIKKRELSEPFNDTFLLTEEMCERLNKKGYDPTEVKHSHLHGSSGGKKVKKQGVEDSNEEEDEANLSSKGAESSKQSKLESKGKEGNGPERPSEVKEKVKRYLGENSGASIPKISKDLDCNPRELNNVLYKMIQEGKIYEPKEDELKLVK